MQDQPTAARGPLCVARGHGVRIRVHRGHLIVEDSAGRDRRMRRYHRTSKLKRLVLIGRTGYLTFEALSWVQDVGGALVHLDPDGQLVTISAAKGPDLAPLRRAQALTTISDVGVEIARELIATKIKGQASLLGDLPGGQTAAPVLDQALLDVERGDYLPALLAAEAQAAAAYWSAWADLPMPFGRADAKLVPEHWRAFGQRHSLLTNSPRAATNPANAILNYLYAVLEAEATLACHAVGLDPGIGIFHADRRDRASLALDAIEAVRPIVDAYVLALLTQRTLSARKFVETRQGSCRLAPAFAAELAPTTSVWRDHVAPVVERIAHTLAEHAPATLPLSTPLTRANARSAWDQRAPQRKRRQPRGGIPSLPATCRDCGAQLTDRRRRYCDECRGRRFTEQGPEARRTAARVLAGLRAEQRDPAHGRHAAKTRGAKNSAHQQAVGAWTGERPHPAIFESEILPALRRVPIGKLVTATGLSKHYCSLIRLGKRVPHPRHWEALANASAIQP